MESLLAAIIGSASIIVAVWQLRSGISAAKVQRVIDLHHDLTTGEVGAARDRFTSLMWKVGEAAEGRNRCHRFTWAEVQSAVRYPDGSIECGELGSYERFPEISDARDAEPMRDLYSVLWCFERIEAGRAGRALDTAMLESTIASHAVWWDELTTNLEPDPKRTTIHLSSLRRLAAALSTEDLRSWARYDFEDR